MLGKPCTGKPSFLEQSYWVSWRLSQRNLQSRMRIHTTWSQLKAQTAQKRVRICDIQSIATTHTTAHCSLQPPELHPCTKTLLRELRNHTRTPECSTLTLVLWSFLFVFITPRAGQMQRSNYWDFVHKQTDQSEREKFTWLSKPKPNSLRTRLPGMPQHQPRQTHTLRSKEEKAACEKELSEIVLFLLQRNWLAWSWTSGKQPKINGENSVGINPGTAVLQTQPGVEAFHKSSSFEAFHSTRWALAAWPRPWREDKYSLTQLTPRIGNATPIIVTEVLGPGLISCFVKL